MSTPEEVAAEIQAETDTRPDYLLERFKTPEDQARAYAEAEKEMNRLRAQQDQERADFAAALERMTEMQPREQTPVPGLDPQIANALAAYEAAVEQGDARSAMLIQMSLNQQITQQTIAKELEDRFNSLNPQLDERRQEQRDIAFRVAEDRVQRQYGDAWTELAPDVNRWLNEHPAILPQVNDPVQWEATIQEAARIVRNDKAAERLAELEADRAAKVNAQTAVGAGQGRYPTQTDEKKAEWEAVVNAPVTSYSQLRNRG